MRVNGKVFVVTGAGSGMGRALSHLLARRGARVAAVDLNEATLRETVERAESLKDRITTHVANITDKARVDHLPAEVQDRHGGVVDGLFNNAGIIQPFVVMNELPFEAIDRVLSINLFGVIYMTKAFLPILLHRPEAHIINTSSMGGFLPVPGQSLYGASKAAVKVLTEALYAELLETNVRVTVVFPGAVGWGGQRGSVGSVGRSGSLPGGPAARASFGAFRLQTEENECSTRGSQLVPGTRTLRSLLDCLVGALTVPSPSRRGMAGQMTRVCSPRARRHIRLQARRERCHLPC